MIFGKKNKFHNPVVSALQEPCFFFDESGVYEYGNDAAQDVLAALGYTKNKMPEQYDAFVKVLRFHGAPADMQAVDLSLKGKRYTVETSLCDGDILLRLMPVRENEHVLRLASTLDVVPWGLVTLGLKGDAPMILHCNVRACEMLGVENSKMIGHYADKVFRVFGLTEDITPYARSSDVTHYDHESRMNDKSCWYRLHFIPYAQKNQYCLVVIEDTTDRKIMEGQYFQAQRLEALGQLAGGVAHDFNNILSVIDGYARLARKSFDEEMEATKYIDHIKNAVQRGAALTGQLLTFGSHKVVKDSIIDLGALVKEQESLLRPLMDASIFLSIKVDENVFIQVTPDVICQILLNLCINARDAMPGGGRLIVEVEKSVEGLAVFRVIDTGCGMPPEVRAKIFDPFFTTKDQGKGTGLGLSMVYGLVKDMGGDIDVYSKVGEGTAITIKVPLTDTPPLKREVSIDEAGNMHLDGFTALVAEDEPDLLNILSGYLEDMGIHVLRASNGNEALSVQDSYDGEIDFLLTDVVMPEMNGAHLAELFESVRPNSRVMFMSGYPEKSLMNRVKLPEGAVMMSKPLNMEKLSSVIRMLAQTPDRSDKSQWSLMTQEWRTANA